MSMNVVNFIKSAFTKNTVRASELSDAEREEVEEWNEHVVRRTIHFTPEPERVFSRDYFFIKFNILCVILFGAALLLSGAVLFALNEYGIVGDTESLILQAVALFPFAIVLVIWIGTVRDYGVWLTYGIEVVD